MDDDSGQCAGAATGRRALPAGRSHGVADATNTGVPAGVVFTPTADDIHSTADGQVIDKMHVTNGTIIIDHNNVTVQRCKIDTTGLWGIKVSPGKTGAIIRDNEVLNPRMASSAPAPCCATTST